MINKNFKAWLQATLLANANKGLIPVTLPNGNTAYLAPYFNNNQIFPYATPSPDAMISSSIASRGIYIGSGNTPATENDYTLQSFISSGITSTGTYSHNLDGNNPYKGFTITLNNTTSSDITVREVGYAIACYTSNTLNNAGSQNYLLIDRTVLDNPLTVPANGTAVLYYELKSII